MTTETTLKPTWWARGLWSLLPKDRRRAFFASPSMAPPLGACGASDLEDRPGAFTIYSQGGLPAYDASCPGCGEVASLLPGVCAALVVRGEGYATWATCAEPIHFRVCCGWYGFLRDGMWKGRPIGGRRQPAGRR